MAIETQTPKLKSTYSQLPNEIQKKKNPSEPTVVVHERVERDVEIYEQERKSQREN
jgi:hypothetical protein